MKKVSGLFASLLLVVLCMVGCGETETPTPQESLQDIRVTGTYVQSSAPSESRIYVYKEKQVNYLQTVGISSQLFQDGNDLYMMVLTNEITEVYKNSELMAVVPFMGLDFFVHGGIVEVVGSASLEGDYPTDVNMKNAVTFNTNSEQITFLDNQSVATSEANYVTRDNGVYYIAGKGLLTSPTPKIMAWRNGDPVGLLSPSTLAQVVYCDGDFVAVGTKVYAAGKSVAVQVIDSVESILSDTKVVDEASVFVTKIQDVYVDGKDLYIAAIQTVSGKSTLVVWKNGFEYYTLESIGFAKIVYKYNNLYMVTKGMLPADPYVIRCNEEIVTTLPTDITSVNNLEVR